MIQILINSFKLKQDERIWDFIMFLILCVLVISLPTSRAFVSITQGLLAANWLAGRDFKEKLQRFSANKPAVYLVALFFVYVIGLLWTGDLNYGVGQVLKDKLPFLSLVFVVSSSRMIPEERIHSLFILFSLSVLFATLIGFITYVSGNFTDTRELSPFILHVHLSMMIVLTIFLFPWVAKQLNISRTWYYASILVSVWLLFYLFILSSLTGILSLLGVGLFVLLRFVFRKPVLLRVALVSFVFLAGALASFYVINQVTKPLSLSIEPDPASLQELTAEGNPYLHNFQDDLRENGHLVYFFISDNELRKAWNSRSYIDFDSLDEAGNEIRYTIYRYLSSRGLRKDKEGLSNIDENEVQAIERGVVNYLHLDWPMLMVRLHQTLWEYQEYQRTRDPHGHSFTKRIEIWRGTWLAFTRYPILGWGTGDVLHAIDFGLEKMNSKLEDHRLRHPHNQFLHVLVMMGIVGFIIIFGLIFFFIKSSGAVRFFPFNIFLIIMFVSMLGNSPLDSQISLNFFLFFCLVFGISLKNNAALYPEKRQNSDDI
ncbi:MAG: O-antigen ligase domain-containing protein [Bacteroidetes bacterium]|nr:MAG: O-antigen ligase domain-containing protein [Bacteroidota bacterium]